MLPYCLKCRKYTESKNPKVVRTKNGRIMLLPKCGVCDSKKSKFIKEQEASGLLICLGINTSFKKNQLLGPLLSQEYKLNEIVNKLLLARYKFMTEMHLNSFKAARIYIQCLWSIY